MKLLAGPVCGRARVPTTGEAAGMTRQAAARRYGPSPGPGREPLPQHGDVGTSEAEGGEPALA
jgi:hypothetical protein